MCNSTTTINRFGLEFFTNTKNLFEEHKSRFYDTQVKRADDDNDDDDDDDNGDGDDDNGYDDHDDNDAYDDDYDNNDNKWKRNEQRTSCNPICFFFGVGHWGRTYAIKSNDTTPR